MIQQEGFLISGKETEVCQLHECIYGLKQSFYVWGKRFIDFNKKHRLKQSEEDPCLFLRINGTEMTILVIYVDDGIITSNQQIFNDEFLAVRGAHFQIRSHVESFVCISINLTGRKRRSTFLSLMTQRGLWKNSG
jgi:hypothetical protein